MNTAEEFTREKFRTFVSNYSIESMALYNIFREGFSLGFDAGVGFKEPKKNNYAKEDLKERPWLLKQDDSNTMYNVTYDIEILKKYVRLLMEWKNASNP